ncbi:hypothetical protein [Catenulispora pinisilvae]|uniref:hypothetical protein n=1 Tax=Catenulispora pinisilvae TaxID=2705253 RepID=UPI0018925F9C|nr:hypothetical protein [Catenulispora pinisilvae]
MGAARLRLRGRAAGWWLLLAVVVAVVAVNGVLAGWSRGSTSHGSGSRASGSQGSGSHSGKPSGPSMVQARSVATEELGLWSGGGWAQAWALWSAAGQAALSEADYVQLNTRCRPALGEPYVIDAATNVDATNVSVTWHQGSMTGGGAVVFEGGKWKYQPDAQTLAAYRGGVAQVVAERKAAGECH